MKFILHKSLQCPHCCLVGNISPAFLQTILPISYLYVSRAQLLPLDSTPHLQGGGYIRGL